MNPLIQNVVRRKKRLNQDYYYPEIDKLIHNSNQLDLVSG
jgi:hypothetical protein